MPIGENFGKFWKFLMKFDHFQANLDQNLVNIPTKKVRKSRLKMTSYFVLVLVLALPDLSYFVLVLVPVPPSSS